MSIMDKLKKNSKIKTTEVLEKSKFFTEKDMVSTDVPMVNVALSGSINGGVTPGLTVLAGPSKHFKTSFALLMAGAYLKEKEDAVLLFYDSEFGSPQSYFEQFGIDTSRVLHTPIANVEELKFDLISQLENIDRTDNVIIVIDSIGNLASKKELEDAMNEKSVADMSRAKALKGLFRMVTPYLTMKNIPMLAVNHTYKEIGLFPKDIVGGGTGIYYSSDNIWIIGRQQDKQGTEIKGYHFVINIEKSRYVKEKSKIPISVSWEGGVQQFSGLLDVALAGGYVVKPSNGWYSIAGEEKKVRQAETLTKDFWTPVILYQPLLGLTTYPPARATSRRPLNCWTPPSQGTEIKGYHFVINIEKSRYVKEKSNIPISVSWEGGVQQFSGLLDVALAGGYVVKPSNGWYSIAGEEKKVRQAETLTKDFWTPVFENTDFADFIKSQYSIGLAQKVDMDEIAVNENE